MAERYPGGIISKTPPTVTPPVASEGGSASGMWTLDTVLEYEKAGAWPKPVLPRELYAWGQNLDGPVGDNTVVRRSSPVQVGALVDWSSVSAGGFHSLALKDNNTLWGWGQNLDGQVGDGTAVRRSSPVQIGALTNWSKVYAGGAHSLAIKSDNTLWAWGVNFRGQIGDNTVVAKSSPIQIGSSTDWASAATGGVQSIGSSFAIKTTGSIWAWGNNGLGGLGIGTTTNTSSPVQIGALTNWSKISAGGGAIGATSAFAVKTDGTLWSWGGNDRGQLGLGTAVSSGRSSPVQVGALTTWAQVAGGSYSAFALRTNNTLWSWGYDNSGRLGLNTNLVSRSSPVQIGSLTDWSQVSSSGGRVGASAIRSNGTLWSWGANSSGEVGDGTVVTKSSPVQVGALTNWETVSVGGNHASAITKD